MIEIRQPLFFSEIGKKDNQEDYVFPTDATADTRVFILCDGMGGHDNGEVASRIAGITMGEYLSSRHPVSIDDFKVALSKAYDSLDSIDSYSAKKPGTTMVCLCLNDDDYLVAHIGDSRIYHIRPSLFDPESKYGGILYQSADHSLVNDLLKAGELTEEEARNFPQKNIITRALQPHLPKRYPADVYVFNDLQDNDFFFICCDGILEQLSNEKLCEILSKKNTSDSEKLSEIKAICDGNTRDNYTCWLIPIEKVNIENTTKLNNVIIAESEDTPLENDSRTSTAAMTDVQAETNQNKINDRKSNPKKQCNSIIIPIILIAIDVIVLLCTLYLFIRRFNIL